MANDRRVSVIIPTLNEAETLPALLADLAAVMVPMEIVVADGGSDDATARLAVAAGARVVQCERGRGVQLRAGIAATQGSVLCVLHADVRLPSSACAELRRLLSGEVTQPWAFRLGIDSRQMRYRAVEIAANLRSQLVRLPYGDQGLIISRALYDRVGGYAPITLMEDVAIALALRKVAPIQLLRSSVLVSPRRWARDGVIRRSARNIALLGRYLAGAEPHELAPWYTPDRPE